MYARAAQYNAAIANYLSDQVNDMNLSSPFMRSYEDGNELRYGENSHQKAWLYVDKDCPDAESSNRYSSW